ncbi:hypothetical protein quinque_006521 [Culex quinquefasciatus]
MAWGYWSATAVDRGRSPRRNTQQQQQLPYQTQSYQQQQQQQQYSLAQSQHQQSTQCLNSCPQQQVVAVPPPEPSPPPPPIPQQQQQICDSPCHSPCHSPQFLEQLPPDLPCTPVCTFSRRQSLDSPQANQLSDIICRAVQPSIQSAGNTLTRGTSLRTPAITPCRTHIRTTHHYTDHDHVFGGYAADAEPGSDRARLDRWFLVGPRVQLESPVRVGGGGGGMGGGGPGSIGTGMGSMGGGMLRMVIGMGSRGWASGPASMMGSMGMSEHGRRHGREDSVMGGGGICGASLHGGSQAGGLEYVECSHYDRMPLPIPVQIPMVPPMMQQMHSEDEIEPAYATGTLATFH